MKVISADDSGDALYWGEVGCLHYKTLWIPMELIPGEKLSKQQSAFT